MGSLPPLTMPPRRPPAFSGNGKTDETDDDIRSLRETGRTEAARTVAPFDEPDDQFETRRPRRNNEEQAPRRTKVGVFLDMTKRYILSKDRLWDHGEHNLLRDLIYSTAIGSILAIGTPVAAVTIPTAMAIWTAVSMTSILISALKNPNGREVNEMYQRWQEIDAEKAAERRS